MKLNSFSPRYIAILLAFLVFGFTSCKDDEEGSGTKPTKNLYELLSVDANHSVFLAAVDRAGLKSMLTGTTKYTLLVPSNQDLSVVDLSSYSDAEVKNYLLYYMHSGAKASADFSNATYYTTLAKASNGEYLSVYIKNEGAPAFNDQVMAKTTTATNGIFMEIFGALEALNVLDMLRLDPTVERYKDGIIFESTAKSQVENKENTVFATLNAPLDAYLKTQNSGINTLKPSLRRAIINNSIIKDKVLTSSNVAGTHPTLATEMVVTVSGDAIDIDGKAKVVVKNIQCTNGVIFIIDNLLN